MGVVHQRHLGRHHKADESAVKMSPKTLELLDRAVETGLYILIGALSAALTYAQAGDFPQEYGKWIGIVLGGLVAWKAKRSPGRESDRKPIAELLESDRSNGSKDDKV